MIEAGLRRGLDAVGAAGPADTPEALAAHATAPTPRAPDPDDGFNRGRIFAPPRPCPLGPAVAVGG